MNTNYGCKNNEIFDSFAKSRQPHQGLRTNFFIWPSRRGLGADASKRRRNEKSECVSYRFLLRHGDGHDATVSVGMEDDDIEPLASDEHLSETVQRGDTDFVGMFGGEASGMVRKTEGANFGAVAVAKNQGLRINLSRYPSVRALSHIMLWR